jgi:hypothetical protein
MRNLMRDQSGAFPGLMRMMRDRTHIHSARGKVEPAMVGNAHQSLPKDGQAQGPVPPLSEIVAL